MLWQWYRRMKIYWLFGPRRSNHRNEQLVWRKWESLQRGDKFSSVDFVYWSLNSVRKFDAVSNKFSTAHNGYAGINITLVRCHWKLICRWWESLHMERQIQWVLSSKLIINKHSSKCRKTYNLRPLSVTLRLTQNTKKILSGGLDWLL